MKKERKKENRGEMVCLYFVFLCAKKEGERERERQTDRENRYI